MGPERNKETETITFFICLFVLSFVITSFIANIMDAYEYSKDRVCMVSLRNFGFFLKWNVGYWHWEYIEYIESTTQFCNNAHTYIIYESSILCHDSKSNHLMRICPRKKFLVIQTGGIIALFFGWSWHNNSAAMKI